MIYEKIVNANSIMRYEMIYEKINVAKYHPSIRILHWLMFVLFAIIFVFGIVMVE